MQYPCPSPETCSQQNQTPVASYKNDQFPPQNLNIQNGSNQQHNPNSVSQNPNTYNNKTGRSPSHTQRRPYSPDYSTDSSYFDNNDFTNGRNNNGSGRGRSPGFGSNKGSRGSAKSHRSRSKSSERKSYTSSNEKKGNKCHTGELLNKFVVKNI